VTCTKTDPDLQNCFPALPGLSLKIRSSQNILETGKGGSFPGKPPDRNRIHLTYFTLQTQQRQNRIKILVPSSRQVDKHRLVPESSGRIFRAWATAWELSRAGIIPSSLHRILNASTASSSVTET
jgi:hypothetical protein